MIDRAPTIRIDLFSRGELSAMEDAGDAVLSVLADDPQLAPRTFDAREAAMPFPGEAVNELWKKTVREKQLLFAKGSRRLGIYCSASFGFSRRNPFHCLHWSATANVLSLRDALARIETLFRCLAVAFDSWYGFAAHGGDFERQNVILDFPHPESNSVEPYHIEGYPPIRALPGLYWLNYFGAEYTGFIGADRLGALDPPAESLGRGMMLKLATSPSDMMRPEVIEHAEALKRQLGADLFFDVHDHQRSTRAPEIPLIYSVYDDWEWMNRDNAMAVEALRAAGCEVESVYDLVNTSASYPHAISTLVDLLSRVSHPRILEGVVRALTVPEARWTEAPRLMVQLFEREPPGYTFEKAAIANALSVIADETVLEPLIRMATDRAHGLARAPLLEVLARFRGEPRVEAAVRSLLDDEDLTLHAIQALRSLRAVSARPQIEKLLDHPTAWIRDEARKALTSFDKLEARAAAGKTPRHRSRPSKKRLL